MSQHCQCNIDILRDVELKVNRSKALGQKVKCQIWDTWTVTFTQANDKLIKGLQLCNNTKKKKKKKVGLEWN